MSSYGTPRPTSRAARPTQPPPDGPSLLATTPLRTPSSLRPALFHPRSAVPHARTLTPTTTTALAHAHARAPASAPRPLASTSTAAHPHSNPFDALPAAAFDSFVASLTTSIRTALAPSPESRRELPSARRRRERDEHARERDEARREREERARAREEERAREREEAEERRARGEDEEEDAQDVFGEVKEVQALSAPASASDAGVRGDEELATEPIIQDFALSPSPSPAPSVSPSRSRSQSRTSTRSPPAPAPLEMRQLPPSLAQSRPPLFVPHSAGSASASDHEPLGYAGEGHGEAEYGREGTYGLETAPSRSPSLEIEGDAEVEVEVEVDAAEAQDGYAAYAYDELDDTQGAEDDLDVDAEAGDALDSSGQSASASEPEVEVDGTRAQRDPFGRPVRYAHSDDDGQDDGERAGYAAEDGAASFAHEDLAPARDEELGLEYEHERRDARDELEPEPEQEQEREQELPHDVAAVDGAAPSFAGALAAPPAPAPAPAAAAAAQLDLPVDMPLSPAAGAADADADEPTKRTKSGTELLELGSSSDLEPDLEPAAHAPAQAPPAEPPVVAQHRARRAVYGSAAQAAGDEAQDALEPVAVEQPHLVERAPALPFAADAAMLDALPPWLAAGVGLAPYASLASAGPTTTGTATPDLGDEDEEGGGASSAAWADVEDEGQDEADELEGEGLEGEWYGEGVPGDEVEMGREEQGSGSEGDAEMADGELDLEGEGEREGEPVVVRYGDEKMLDEDEAAAARNPLEGVYADEDSEDVRPRIPYSAKGKARAPPTPSDLSRAESRSPRASSRSLSPTSRSSSPAFNLDAALLDWATNGAPNLPELAVTELLDMHDELLVQLQRAAAAGSEIGLLVLQQVKDVEKVFEELTGRALDPSDGDEDEGETEGERDDPERLALSSDDDEREGALYVASADGETFALPGSPLSARLSSSASPPPAASSSRLQAAEPRAAAADDDDADEPDTADRSAYFPNLERGTAADADAAHAAAEARLDEIAGELIEMREGGFVGALRVERSGVEELDEDELELDEDEGVGRGSEVIEVETDGETVLPSEVVSVRGTSVLSDRSLAYLDVQAIESSIAADSADEQGRRSPESPPAAELADEPLAHEHVPAASSTSASVDAYDGDDNEMVIVEETAVTESIDLVEQPAELERPESPEAAARAEDVPSSSMTEADLEQPARDEAVEPTRDEAVEPTRAEDEDSPQQDVLAAERATTQAVVEHAALDVEAESAALEPAALEPAALEPVALEPVVAEPTTPHASFAPSAPVDPAFDAPPAPSVGDAASTGDPRVPLSTISAPHLSSHFRLAPGPTPALDSPIPYPPVHAEHSVDSPVHSDDDDADLVDKAPVRVGVSDEEMRDAALVGRHVPLARLQDGSPTRLKEAHDLPSDDGEAQGGLTIFDDDASFPPSRLGELESVAPAPAAPAHGHAFIGATPPPVNGDEGDQQNEPPIVAGVAPPQNLALVPETAPPSPPAAHVEPVAPTPAPALSEPEQGRDASPAAALESQHASFAPSAPVDPAFDGDLAPTALDLARSPSPAAPSSAMSPRAFSSHFQLAPGPTPALDSPIPYPPVHVEHSVDSPVHSDGERVDQVDEAPVRVGLDEEEMRDETLAGKVRPLEGAVDASGAAGALEQVDVEMGGAVGASGLLVIDDDADAFAPVAHEPLAVEQTSFAPVDSVEQLEPARSTVDTDQPLSTALAVTDDEPPILDGIAPPQNPALLPDLSPPPSPATLGDALALTDTHTLPPAPSTAHADPQPADEVRFEDFITLDESADEDTDSDGSGDSDEDVMSLLVPERKRLAPSGGEVDVGPVLGLPAGEEVVTGERSNRPDGDDETSSSSSSPAETSNEPGEPPLASETVGETAVEPLEAGEDVEADDSAAEARATSQAPSSEPISYRSEDELAFLEPEGGDGPDEPASDDEDNMHDTLLLIHGVVDPGEWDPSQPIQFGSVGDELDDADMDNQADEIIADPGAAEQASSNPHDYDNAESAPAAPPRSPARLKTSLDAPETTPRRTRSADLATPAAPAEASPARRSTRLSSVVHDTKATAAPSSSSPKPQTPAAKKRSRKDDAGAGPSSTAKRVRRSGQPKHGTASASEEDREVVVPGSSSQHASGSAPRHHHHPAPLVGDERSRSSDAPLTRSRCAYVRLRIRSSEAPRSAPYLVQVPSCALTSAVAKETMRAFDIENLGPVQDSDDCDGIQLGGHGGADSYAADSLHEALVPHGDVLAALQRLVGPDLWHEGAVEVLPRGGGGGGSAGKGVKRKQ